MQDIYEKAQANDSVSNKKRKMSNGTINIIIFSSLILIVTSIVIQFKISPTKTIEKPIILSQKNGIQLLDIKLDQDLYALKGDSTQTLKEAAEGTGVFMGSCMKWYPLDTESDYNALGAKEFNMVTACNECKMSTIAKLENDYNFTGCDYIANYAKQNNMLMRGHVLLWASTSSYQNPSYINSETDPAKKLAFLKKFITETVTHLNETIYAWDVINEAVTDGSTEEILKETPWKEVDDFACNAFKYAHEADPLAELYYNDYNILTTHSWYQAKADKVFNFIKDLKDRGCPIHGVGFQAHIKLDFGDDHIAAYKTNMARYNDIGIKVHITELTVKCNHDDNYVCDDDVETDDNLQLQATIYRKLLQGCLDAPNCLSFITWGFTERFEWTKAPRGVPFTSDLTKKKAYYGMRYALQNFDQNSEAAINKYKLQKQTLNNHKNKNRLANNEENSAKWLCISILQMVFMFIVIF